MKICVMDTGAPGSTIGGGPTEGGNDTVLHDGVLYAQPAVATLADGAAA